MRDASANTTSARTAKTHLTRTMEALDTPYDIFTRYMTEQGMRKTPERYAIMDVVVSSKGHNSADQVLSMMPDNFHVSRGTVYSTLSLLVDSGLAYSHNVGGITLYENAYGVATHHHYICSGCNKIWDLCDTSLDHAITSVRTPKFKKMKISAYIYGYCNICQAKLARIKKKMEREKLNNMTREEQRFARIDEELSQAAEWITKDIKN